MGEKAMADDLIAKALTALKEGNVESAEVVHKALGYVIVGDDRRDSADAFDDDGIRVLINKAGLLG